MNARRSFAQAAILAAVLFAVVPAAARTIVLDARSIDRMAGIAAAAPRQSWALYEARGGVFDTSRVTLAAEHSFLTRFSLDRIPPKQRIVHAELVLTVSDVSGSEPRFYLWRVTASWGPGVSYLHRTVQNHSVPWTRPGARGYGSDRAARPTEIVRLTTKGEVTVNVTEDVDLWYSGAATNEGWLLSVEDPLVSVSLPSPLSAPDAASLAWKLRVTYEPQ